MSEQKSREAVIVSGARGFIGKSLCEFLRSDYIVIGADLKRPAHGSEDFVGDYFVEISEYNNDGLGELRSILRERPIGTLSSLIVCNGSEGNIDDVENHKDGDVEATIAASITPVMSMLKEVVPTMKESKYGRVVLFSSLATYKPNALMPGYTCSKHAIEGLVKSLARELGPFGIRVNCIAPGPLKSRMQVDIQKLLLARRPDTDSAETVVNELARAIPLGRLCERKDINGVVTFLMSEDSSFITGQVLRVDGGASVK